MIVARIAMLSIAASLLASCAATPVETPAPLVAVSAETVAPFDTLLRGGTIYDGTGAAPFVGDVGVIADKIAYVGPATDRPSKAVIDAHGKAIAPGFINMLAHPEESLLVDGRALSDIKQGVTLEVMGEVSMGPLSAKMKRELIQSQGDIKYDVDWTTFGEYLDRLDRRKISPNVASFVGASTVREVVLGSDDVQPTAAQLDEMKSLVHQAMREGALGVTDALIYTPATFAKTPELIALATESARCDGMFTAHMRSEGDRIEAAVQEMIDIADASGGPVEIYHYKLAGRDNWGKFDKIRAMIEAARARGVKITADMYTYTAGATGLDAAMPPWVQAGGIDSWVERLKKPDVRAKVIAEMRNPHPANWENLYAGAGPEGTLLLGFNNPALKPLIGKSLADVAKMRGKSPEEVAMDLVIEDHTRVGIAYFLMSEDNVRKSVKLPWMSFGSDADAPAPEGNFLKSSRHPRTYGNFARLLGHYVRDNGDITLSDAVYRLTGLPAANLRLHERGTLKPGFYADLVVFDPATVADHATFDKPHQLATGISDVFVNGIPVLKDGNATGADAGRIIRGPGWSGWPDGGACK